MNVATQTMLMLRSEAADVGVLPDDLAELFRVNMVGTPIENVMRIRALTELSAHVDATTLMALAAAASSHRAAIDELVSALSAPRQ